MFTHMINGSLAYQVYSLIATQQAVCAQRFALDFDCSVYHNTVADEVEILNRYWRAQLSDVPELDKSAAVRHAHEALTFSFEHPVWLMNFNRFVMPLILRFELPKL